MIEKLKPFSQRAIEVISSIPKGSVASYGQIAAICGSPRSARQVSRLLHSCSESFALPWHRVVGNDGSIRLSGSSAERQKEILRNEGVGFMDDGHVNMNIFRWNDD